MAKIKQKASYLPNIRLHLRSGVCFNIQLLAVGLNSCPAFDVRSKRRKRSSKHPVTESTFLHFFLPAKKCELLIKCRSQCSGLIWVWIAAADSMYYLSQSYNSKSLQKWTDSWGWQKLSREVADMMQKREEKRTGGGGGGDGCRGRLRSRWAMEGGDWRSHNESVGYVGSREPAERQMPMEETVNLTLWFVVLVWRIE